MEAMGTAEAAVVSALKSSGPTAAQVDAEEVDHQQIARISQPVHEALSLSGFSDRKWDRQQSGA